MSGGAYDYKQYHIRDIWEEIQREIDYNEQEFSEQTLAIMTYAVSVLKMAEVYAHRIDWLLSGDDGEETFVERLKSDAARLLKDVEEVGDDKQKEE